MKPAIVLCLVFIATRVFAAADQLETTLNHQYKDRIYTFRQPMTAPVQQYDAQGNSPTASALGPWTVYGRMQIRKIKVERTGVIIEGQRIGTKFGSASAVVPVKLKDQVTLQISVNGTLQSAGQFNSILEHIFAFTKEDFLASLPEFWRAYAQVYLKSYSDDGEMIEFKTPGEVRQEYRKEPLEEAPPGVETLKPRRGITPPQPKNTPDPQRTKAATEQELFGILLLTTTVDETGRITGVRLVRPLGLGLEESSADTVRTWLFKPGTKDGKPVKIKMDMDIEFHQYH
ncbi:MAG TPA: energy transducer TonB [Candidatus Angelobacter sp.]